MTFPRIWIAWLLALVFGFAAPAQAMRGLAGLGTPLGAKSHRVNNPINFSDPSGLNPDFWDIQNNPESYPIPTVRDTILETGGIVLTGLAIYAGVEVVLGTAELISDLGLVRGAVSAGHAYQSETMALILGTQQVPSPKFCWFR